MALVDDVIIKIAAGNGGNGGRSFHQNYGSIKSTGDGGNGGRGGNIYFEGTSNLNDLSDFRFKKKIHAPDGERGMNNNLDGKKGEDVTILVPLGTTIIDTATEKAIEILEEKIPVLLAKGGRGQTGNHDRRGPQPIENGMPQNQKGEKKELHLILNLIADIGLIGLPNAGKSSLLKTLTNALPKIGNYAFTTLEPNLGTIPTTPGEKNIVIADIPGLVEGASVGRGLGIQFLKHIQKTKVLIHCIDATQSAPYETYLTVRQEFDNYDSTLLDKNEIILLTKIDLVEPAALKEQLTALKKTKKKILTTSIYDEKSIALLKENILKLITF
jgi:GTPase